MEEELQKQVPCTVLIAKRSSAKAKLQESRLQSAVTYARQEVGAVTFDCILVVYHCIFYSILLYSILIMGIVQLLDIGRGIPLQHGEQVLHYVISYIILYYILLY